MNDKLTRIYHTKISPELDAFGDNLTRNHVEEIVNELSDIERIGVERYSIGEDDKKELLDYALESFGLTETEHVYVRGGGFYRDDEETELRKEEWTYYHKHRKFISANVFKNQPRVVESIDFETDQIIKKIPNPTIEGNQEFLNKGLVVGYVQSGKTANFTHLISKAASIGYKFVLILGGMTNTLRSQTQFRLDRELTGNNQYKRNDIEFVRWQRNEAKYVTLTKGPDHEYNEDGDFHIPSTNFSDHFKQTNDVTIGVVKKLARQGDEYSPFKSVLGRLIRWVENRNDPDAQMPPLLIIDDEADQASIDANEPDMEPTTINHALRYFINLFDQVSYVGYTATPFANVFIDASSMYNGLEDLYPNDFIYSLPEPPKYFGTRQFFGTEWLEGEEANAVYVNNVPDNEKQEINEAEGDLTDSLKRAFWEFVFAVIIRRYRGDNGHVGFMIHTDHRNIYHDTVRYKLSRYLDVVSDSLEFGSEDFKGYIFSLWTDYLDKSDIISRVRNYHYETPGLDKNELLEKSLEVFKEMKVKVINGPGDTLDYNSEDLRTLICIGGNIMSRGVTIEGLTISYYLRESPRYDTLLQMARWFGYRIGYEDLVRVYTTETIEDYFTYIMGVETDLRSEIDRYQQERLTPAEFAPRVRAHMRMLPSSKMGVANIMRSYSNQSAQTIYLSRNIDTLRNNNEAVRRLAERSYSGENRTDLGNFDMKNQEIDLLIRFIADFNIPDPEIAGFDKEDVLRYINVRKNNGEFQNFDLRIAGRKAARQDALLEKITEEIIVNPVKRSARKGSGWSKINDNIVNVGVISDSNDMPGTEEKLLRPRLIIYSIDKENSDSFKEHDDEGKVTDNVIDGLDFNPKGYALVFPESETAEGETDYYQQIFR